jgi:hypothetical protein
MNLTAFLLVPKLGIPGAFHSPTIRHNDTGINNDTDDVNNNNNNNNNV